MFWGLMSLGFFINSKQEAFSWKEIGYIKKIGKVGGSRCQTVDFSTKILILKSFGTLKKILMPLSLSRAIKYQLCLLHQDF